MKKFKPGDLVYYGYFIREPCIIICGQSYGGDRTPYRIAISRGEKVDEDEIRKTHNNNQEYSFYLVSFLSNGKKQEAWFKSLFYLEELK